jgi:hypothetical protein
LELFVISGFDEQFIAATSKAQCGRRKLGIPNLSGAAPALNGTVCIDWESALA